MGILQIILWILTGLLLIGTLIPLLRVKQWWLRAWTYARLQKLCIAVLLGAVYFTLFGFSDSPDTITALILIGIALTCLRDILPFTVLGKTQVEKVKDASTNKGLKLLVGNVLMDNDQSQGLLDQIRKMDPDLIFLVETNQDWQSYCSDLDTHYPHQWLLPLEDYNGMLLYSKLPLSEITERRLVQDHIPSIRLNLTLPSDDIITFYGLHPRPPRPEDDTENLDEELILVAEEVKDLDTPIIVTGDLNDVGWSTTTKTFLKLSGLLDPRRGRGLFNSYNAKIPIVRWPLDHVFHSRHFDLVDIKRLEKFGSDHFPIFIHLALKTE